MPITLHLFGSWPHLSAPRAPASLRIHREIQQLLVKLGDKPSSFVGSSNWVGAIELSYILDEYLGVVSKILTVNRWVGSRGEGGGRLGGWLGNDWSTGPEQGVAMLDHQHLVGLAPCDIAVVRLHPVIMQHFTGCLRVLQYVFSSCSVQFPPLGVLLSFQGFRHPLPRSRAGSALSDACEFYPVTVLQPKAQACHNTHLIPVSII
jgi:hypothetical protein